MIILSSASFFIRSGFLSALMGAAVMAQALYPVSKPDATDLSERRMGFIDDKGNLVIVFNYF